MLGDGASERTKIAGVQLCESVQWNLLLIQKRHAHRQLENARHREWFRGAQCENFSGFQVHGGDTDGSSACLRDFGDLAVEIGLGECGQADQEAQAAHIL